MKNKTLIIGKGEVGNALFKVLSKTYHNIYIKDVEDLKINDVDLLHICYPYSKKFIKITENYIKQYNPKYTIIHSTVKVGTTRKLGKNVWHSPIRGIHPNIDSGILTFPKYLGGKYNKKLIKYFKNAKIEVQHTLNPETTELGKLLDTTYYGWNIIFCKETKRICKKYNADFDIVYTKMNDSYNRGYKILGKPNVSRPILIPIDGKIGGHCVINNCYLLKDKITKTILDFNKKYDI